MTEQPVKRGPGRHRKVAADAPAAEAAKPPRRRKNMIGSNVMWIPPSPEQWKGTTLGYSAKRKPKRPVLQANRV